jgi:hypothetical protein
MDRRTFLRGVAGAVPAGAIVTQVQDKEDRDAVSYQIIGMYAALNYENRAIALQKLRDTGEPELMDLADAFERQL